MNQARKIIEAQHGNSAALAEEAESDAADVGVEVRELCIPRELHAARLDVALAELVPEFSRNYLRQLIQEGATHLAGVQRLKPAHKVRMGDRVSIELRPTPVSQAFRPEAMDLHVVFEDEDILVINKPAGLVVHPAPGHWSGTLLNGLLARDARAADLPRAGIVHRLDMDTSGLMVVARSRAAMDVLVDHISRHEVHREYLALAHHPWDDVRRRDVAEPLGRDPRNRLRMAVVDLQRHSGKTALTHFTLLQNTAQGCLLRCVLETGRTHQIRVHAAWLHHPLVGDALYGGAPAAGMQRQALHAWRLAFTHPITGTPLEFRAELPTDLQAALQEWNLTIPRFLDAAPASVPTRRGVDGE